jgi:hypothetical protein
LQEEAEEQEEEEVDNDMMLFHIQEGDKIKEVRCLLAAVVQSTVMYARNVLSEEAPEQYKQLFINGCKSVMTTLRLTYAGFAAVCGVRPKCVSVIANGRETKSKNAQSILTFLVYFGCIKKSTSLDFMNLFTTGASQISNASLHENPEKFFSSTASSQRKSGPKWEHNPEALWFNLEGKLRAAILATGSAAYKVEYGKQVVIRTWQMLLQGTDAKSRNCVAEGEARWKARALIYVNQTWVSGVRARKIKKEYGVDNKKTILAPDIVAATARANANAATPITSTTPSTV